MVTKDNGSACSALNVDHLVSLRGTTATPSKIKGSPKLAMITPECFAEIKGTSKEELSKVVSLLPDEVLSKFEKKLHGATLAALKPAQLSAWGKDLENDTVCNGVNLGALSKEALAAATPRCIRGAYEHGQKLGRKIARIPLSVWESLRSADMDFVKNIDANDIPFLSKEVLQIIIDTESARTNLAKKIPAFRETMAGLALNADFMATLAEESPLAAASMLFYSEELPSNILSKVEAAHLKGLKLVRGKHTLTGLAFIDALRSRPNFAEIIAMAGEDATLHICSALNQTEFLNSSALRTHYSTKCKEELKFSTTSPAFLKAAPEFAMGDDFAEHAVQTYKPPQWKSMTAPLLSYLARNGRFCADLGKAENKEILEAIPTSIKNVFGDKCVHAFRSRVTKENAKDFGDNAFASFTVDEFTFELTDLTPAQVSFVSASLANDDKAHVFATKVTVDVLKALDNERLAAISARQWSVMPAGNAAVLTADKVKLVKASSLTRFTDAHLDAMTEEALVAMSPEQISMVGKTSKAKLSAFDKVASKLEKEKEKADALAARKATPSTSTATTVAAPVADAPESSSNMWLWIIAALVAVIVIAIAAFIVMRK